MTKKNRNLFVFFLLVTTQAAAQPESDSELIRRLSFSQEWLRIMHYQPRYFGGWKSEADQPGFFISPEGKKNPEAELQANLEMFRKSKDEASLIGKFKEPPHCAFPLRHRFLTEHFSLPAVDSSLCTGYIEWRKKVSGDSLSLIFSSYFPGVPASIFGHTFLRVNNPRSPFVPKDGKKLDYLDFAIDFSAITPADMDAIRYGLYGILGGHPGYYGSWPYYVKVKSYVNAENRDLYEYRLNLNESEVERVLQHLWELDKTYFDYYFFDENCSYQLLTLLEVGRPSLNLSSKFPNVVVPADTVRVVIEQAGVIGTPPVHRPSLKKKLFARWELLTPERQRVVQSVLGKHQFPEIPQPEFQDAAVLEAINATLTYRDIQSGGQLPAEDAALLHRSQIVRAQLKEPMDSKESAAMIPVFRNSPPETGHLSSRVMFTGGLYRDQPYTQFAYRGTLHDLWNRDDGYDPFSQMEVLDFSLRYYSTVQKFKVDQLKLMDAYSLTPLHALEKKSSFHLSLGGTTLKDLSACFACNAANVLISYGYSVGPWRGGWIAYLLAGGILDAGPALNSWMRIGPVLETGVLFEVADSLKVGVQSKVPWYLFPKQVLFEQVMGRVAYQPSKRWDLRLSGGVARGLLETELSLGIYF